MDNNTHNTTVNNPLSVLDSHSLNVLDKSMKLTEHFTLGEMTRTSVKVPNIPGADDVRNLMRLCRWLELLRVRWNMMYGEGDEPVTVNSGFRSHMVNKAVGGATESNHLTGCAADIRVSGMEQMLRYAVILLDISDEAHEDFDELLLERRGPVMWLHFAVRPQGNRRKIRPLLT